jgi:hypothetical protein
MVKFLTLPVMYALLALVVGIGVFAGVQTVRLANANAAAAKVESKLTTANADLDKIAARANAAEKQLSAADQEFRTEQSRREALYEQEKKNAYDKGLAYGRSIAAGDLRLRDVWTDHACPTSGETDGAADVGKNQTVPDDRAVAIGRVLGKGPEWDAAYEFLYAEYVSARKGWQQCLDAGQ